MPDTFSPAVFNNPGHEDKYTGMEKGEILESFHY